MTKFTLGLASPTIPTMTKQLSRRSLLKGMAAAGSGLFLMQTKVCPGARAQTYTWFNLQVRQPH